MKVVVAKLSDFPDGSRKIIDVDGRSVGVFRIGDVFYAIRNRCPHQHGPLCLGTLTQRATSGGPGDVHIDLDGPWFIRCPWHSWEYDLSTGQSFLGAGGRLPEARMYEVQVERGAAVAGEIATGEAAVPVSEFAGDATHPGLFPGPYRVETVEVFVEDDYVVIDD